jgi:hypothetical protein
MQFHTRLATLTTLVAVAALAAYTTTAVDTPPAQPSPTLQPVPTRDLAGDPAFGLSGWEQAAGIQALVEAARLEGEVALLGVGTRDTIDVCRAFNAAFEGIECKPTPLTQSALASIVLADRTIGRQRADVIVAPLPVNVGIGGAGLFSSVDWASYGIQGGRTPGGGGLLVIRQAFYGAGYTPGALAPEDVPRTIDDLLDPALRGAITAPPRSYDRWLGFLCCRARLRLGLRLCIAASRGAGHALHHRHPEHPVHRRAFLGARSARRSPTG